MFDRHEEISYRAYMKWRAAGSPPGNGTEFWYEAEKEVNKFTFPIIKEMEVVSIEDHWDY